MAILLVTGANPILPMMIQPIYDFMPKIKTLIYANIVHVKSTAQEHHRRIMEMIMHQDSQGAFEAMSEHMLLAEEHSNAMLESLEDELILTK